MAQSAEHILGKDEVPGSNPGISSRQNNLVAFICDEVFLCSKNRLFVIFVNIRGTKNRKIASAGSNQESADNFYPGIVQNGAT